MGRRRRFWITSQSASRARTSACFIGRGYELELRPRPAPFWATPLFRGSDGWRAVLYPEPDDDRSTFRGFSDSLSRQSPDPLRPQILPRARPQRTARPRLPDPILHRSGLLRVNPPWHPQEDGKDGDRLL